MRGRRKHYELKYPFLDNETPEERKKRVKHLAYLRNKTKLVARREEFRAEQLLENPQVFQQREREYRLKRRYGLSESDFQTMLELQNDCCLICGKQNDPSDQLCVDHCHSTNKVRGLLCRSCNVGLGYFKDSTLNLSAAITYLRLYES